MEVKKERSNEAKALITAPIILLTSIVIMMIWFSYLDGVVRFLVFGLVGLGGIMLTIKLAKIKFKTSFWTLVVFSIVVTALRSVIVPELPRFGFKEKSFSTSGGSVNYKEEYHLSDDELARIVILAKKEAREYGVSFDEMRVWMEKAYKEAKKRDIEPALVLAVIRKESSWKKLAVSSVGCLGLMQVDPNTAILMGYTAEDMLDPLLNIECGIKYLAKMIEKSKERKKNLKYALAYYNVGPAASDKKVQKSIKRFSKKVIEFSKDFI